MNTNDWLHEYSAFLDSSGEHLSYAALSTYRNNLEELSEKEKLFLRRHLDSCSACTERLREVDEIEEVEQVENKKLHPLQRPRQWTMSPVFRYSIAAALVLALGTVIAVYVLRDLPQDQLASQPPSPTQPLAVQSLDPDRFVANPVLDAFIERTVRSSSTTRFRTPHAGDTVSAPIHFEWDPTKGPFSLIILDNKNRDIFTMLTSETHAVVDTQLASGLYYAKLEAGGNLADVTKFYIMARQD